MPRKDTADQKQEIPANLMETVKPSIAIEHRKAMRELEVQIASNRSLIAIVSPEERRALDAIHIVCRRDEGPQWALAAWDIASGVLPITEFPSIPEKPIYNQKAVLQWFGKQETIGDERMVLVLKDFFKFFGDGREDQLEREVIRELRNVAQDSIGKNKHVILMGTDLKLPSELEKLCAVIDWPLPERELIAAKVKSLLEKAGKSEVVAKRFKLLYAPEEMGEIVSAFQGLTLIEIELLVSYSILTNSRLDPVSIAAKKRDTIRKAGLLEWRDVSENLDSIGGLQELKKWLSKRRGAFGVEAQLYGLPANPKGLLLVGVQGGGKCFAYNTRVLMADGTNKAVQDIIVGDIVMGPDSAPRKVLSLARGRDEMYAVIPTKGESYTVNADHILALRFSVKRRTHACANQDETINISVREYMDQSTSFKQRALGFRVGVDFEFQTIDLDPYFLGIWLGDVGELDARITTASPEIKKFCYDYAAKMGLHVHVGEQTDNLTNTYFLTNEPNTSETNVLRERLREAGLLGNKHIPQIFKSNSREVRLEVLAGLIDTNGYLHYSGYGVTQKHETLAHEIAYLARSLGLAAYVSPCKKSCLVNGKKTTDTYHRTSISGDCSIIPVRILAKKTLRIQDKNVLSIGLTIKPVGLGDYYGFESDGDHLFLLSDFTVVHNSLAAQAIAAYWKLPLLRLDMGRVFGGVVGQSESNIRTVFRIAESVAPCILWVDEIEKGMSGTASSSRTDGGTASRVFGTILTWMQEKQKAVYVVATANDVSQMPPELLRKGRFDEIFFVDLPSDEDRDEIFRIHLEKRGRSADDFNINQLVSLSKSCTGAEIEAAIISAMYDSFDDGVRPLSTGDVAEALLNTVPLAVTMRERIEELRHWATTRARNASIPHKGHASDETQVKEARQNLMSQIDTEEEL